MHLAQLQRVALQSIKTDNAGRLRQLGSAIRAARLERKLSQEALADAAGIDRSHMGKIERGERNVSVLNVARVSARPEPLRCVPDHVCGALGAVAATTRRAATISCLALPSPIAVAPHSEDAARLLHAALRAVGFHTFRLHYGRHVLGWRPEYRLGCRSSAQPS